MHLQRKKTSVPLKVVQRRRKFLWTPLNPDDRDTIWGGASRALPFDEQQLAKDFVAVKNIKSVKVRRAPSVPAVGSRLRGGCIELKEYDRLAVCLRGLRLQETRLVDTLEFYTTSFLDREYGSMVAAVPPPSALTPEELKLLDQALPPIETTQLLEACDLEIPLEARLHAMYTRYPDLKALVRMLVARLAVEHVWLRTVNSLFRAYHFILAFEEAYDPLLKTIFHTMRAMGNHLNEGTYLGNASGFSLESIKTFRTHKSLDGSQSLFDRLQMVLNESGVDLRSLTRLCRNVMSQEDVAEMLCDLEEALRLLPRSQAVASPQLRRVYEDFVHWNEELADVVQDKYQFVRQRTRWIERQFVKFDARIFQNFLAALTGHAAPPASLPVDQSVDFTAIHELPSRNASSGSTPTTADLLEARNSPAAGSCCTACEFESLYALLNETGGLVRKESEPATARRVAVVFVWLRFMVEWLLARTRFSPVALRPGDLDDWADVITTPRTAARRTEAAFVTPGVTRKVQYRDFVLSHMCKEGMLE